MKIKEEGVEQKREETRKNTEGSTGNQFEQALILHQKAIINVFEAKIEKNLRENQTQIINGVKNAIESDMERIIKNAYYEMKKDQQF